MSGHDALRGKIEEDCGMPKTTIDTTIHSAHSFRLSQWSYKFQLLMQNRLQFGAARYGLNFVGNKNKDKIKRVDQILYLANKYKDTGNDELLVDIANFAMMEFEEGIHPNKHFESLDDSKHAEEK